HKGSDNDYFVVSRSHLHADTVVLSTLVFAQQGIGLGVKEVRVRVENPQHSRNRAIVDSFVGLYRLGIVLFNGLVDLRELTQIIADIAVTVVAVCAGTLGENRSQKTASEN